MFHSTNGNDFCSETGSSTASVLCGSTVGYPSDSLASCLYCYTYNCKIILTSPTFNNLVHCIIFISIHTYCSTSLEIVEHEEAKMLGLRTQAVKILLLV